MEKILAEKKGVTTDSLVYAGFWVRFAAFAVDFLVLVLISVAAGIFFAVFTGLTRISCDLEVVSSVVGFLLNAGYYIFMTYRYGATVGKKVFGLKVKSRQEGGLDIGTVIVREVAGKFLAITLAGLGYLWIFCDKKKQGLHDKLASTVVVLADRKKCSSWKVGVVAVIFAVLFIWFSGWIAIGVLDEDFEAGINLDQTMLSVGKTLVAAKLCISEGNSLTKPVDIQRGGGDICSEAIGTSWPKLSGEYRYGELSSSSIAINKNGAVVARCEVESSQCKIVEQKE